MADYKKFATWKKFLTGREDMSETPFDREPLGDSPVFLYSEVTAPLPSASMSGFWTAYSDVHQLGAHLCFALLPADFSIWLCRDEWDSDSEETKPAEAIFEGAEAAKNRFVADIPLMKKIVAELYAAVEMDDDEKAWLRVQKACTLFNSRWESTPTWNFLHKPLRDVKALARYMAAHDSIEEEQIDQIKAIASTSRFGEKAQRQLRSLLKDAVVY